MASENKKASTFVKHDVLKSFNGEGDVIAWLQKAELVAKSTNVVDVASFIPLYLEDGALAVYLEMDADEQGHFEMIKRRLKEAFTDNEFMAYSKLKECRWTGEPVDVLANEVRRIVRTCGLEGAGLDGVVRLAFVTGFPDGISAELQQVVSVEPNVTMSMLVGWARILTANRSGAGVSAPAVTVLGSSGKKPGNGRGCFACGGGHLMRDCPNQGDKIAAKRRSVICYRCGGEGHIAMHCTHEPRGKYKGGRDGGSEGVARAAMAVGRVPVIVVHVGGQARRALVDTGCSNTMIRAELAHTWEGKVCTQAFDGRLVNGRGTTIIAITIDGKTVMAKSTVVDRLVGGIDVVIGMDVIRQLGGVTVGGSEVAFGTGLTCAAINPLERKHDAMVIEDKDFSANFDGDKWTITYSWKGGNVPVLRNKVGLYNQHMDANKRAKFDEEVDKWIEEGILMPWHEEVTEGIVPLMTVEQAAKNKVRPVFDFKELNEYVECHTGDDLIYVCNDVLRQWRQVSGKSEIVDLKSACLQLHVSPELWKNQLVKYKGKTYCLTRLGFGLNCAPRIMTKVLKTVLAQKPDIEHATISYVDDILVNVTKVSAEDVITHLKGYGLDAKPAEKLEGGTALGLKLTRDHVGKLWFSRSNELPVVNHPLSKRELFSLCGKLTAHYPIAGWLRLACSYVKRHSYGEKWDDYIGDVAQRIIEDIMQHVGDEDPVKGEWKVGQAASGTVWCDASELGEGVIMEVDGMPVEDAARLRKSDDYHHINVAELNSVVKGVNLGVKWGLRKIVIMTDSVTVSRWVNLTLTEERRIKTSGAAEILVKRRLAALKALVNELNIKLEVKTVCSAKNKADVLTRVRKEWKELVKAETSVKMGCVAMSPKELHEQHHFGVERSWYLARLVDPSITKEQMRTVVKQCEQCQSIDPAPAQHSVGELSVNATWEWLAVDITHYRGVPYLTTVDCGPGRFAIWRQLKTERADHIIPELAQVFYERGPVTQLLMDNGASFRSEAFAQFLMDWNIKPFFRAAYRPAGNGIVERNHRTIKTVSPARAR